jgi:hypothetical protein
VDNVDPVRQKNDLSDATAASPIGVLLSRYCRAGLGLASRGGLQQAQTLANDLFRVLIAFS